MSQFPYQATYDVQCVENGIIFRQTTPDGLDMTHVYETFDNRKISSEVGEDIFSVLEEEEKEKYSNRLRISVTIEELMEEGGAQ